MGLVEEFEEVLEYVLRAPVVLHPPEEGEEIPASLREKILESRILNVLTGDYERGLASIGDLVAYLYSASLKFPIPPEYVRIYAYYANKLFDGRLSEVMDVPELSDFEKMLADRLRRKILEKQMKALRGASGKRRKVSRRARG